MKALLTALAGMALSMNVAAQVDTFGKQDIGTATFGPGGSASSTIGNVTSHNLGNGILGSSFRNGAITRHSFSNGVTGNSYEYGNRTTHHFSNGVSGHTYQYGNQSTTRLNNGLTISCHTFGSTTRCD